jgi:hypothetical protein
VSGTTTRTPPDAAVARFILPASHPANAVDGAWPGSAVVDGVVVHDAHGGAVWSRLTFVLYLNDCFTGGATTFFTSAPDADGVLEARGVRPVAGNALVFPHGDTAGCLVHEGSAVLTGVKYIVRTDVLYRTVLASSRRTGPS